VTGTRLVVSALAVALLTTSADARDGLIPRTKKNDAAKVKQLTETLRADSGEKKRKAAAVELREYDARVHPEMLAALVGALQKDASAAVRAEAAESIAQSRLVNTVAGLALEVAAVSDPARAVRDAAKQALWEYHLSGYRSTSGADGYVGQSPEPPLAKPPAPRPPIVRVAADTTPPPAPPAPIPDVRVPSVLPAPAFDPPVVTASVSSLPPPEPLAPQTPVPTRMVVLVTAVPPPVLNLTAEPPLAKPLPPLPVRRPLPTYRPALGPTVEPPTAPGPTPSAPLNLPPIPATPAPPVKK
jgi:hypothetical protein